MAGTALVFKSGAGPMLAHLARLSARREWTAARREIGEYLVGDIQDNFDRQRLFDGSPMPQSKAALKRAGKTLIKDHHLYDSYVFQLAHGGVVVGSNKVYAAIHHFGGETGRGHKTKITARPVMGVGERQQRRIGAYLVEAIEAMQ
jgi:phage virion morphogenesis protein